MCLILFAYDSHPDYRLVFAANRDEFYKRPTRSMQFWEEAPDVLAGKDLEAGGTWMGIDRSGRWAAVTNYRQPDFVVKNAASRGHLITAFLTGEMAPQSYLSKVRRHAARYNGFNLLVDDGTSIFHYSNREGRINRVTPGIHGLSNRLLDTPWPKVEKGKAALERIVSQHTAIDPEVVFTLLSDRSRPPDDDLPETGVSLEWERLLSPVFIESETYGTRGSTILLWEKTGRIRIMERTFEIGGNANLKTNTASFEITL